MKQLTLKTWPAQDGIWGGAVHRPVAARPSGLAERLKNYLRSINPAEWAFLVAPLLLIPVLSSVLHVLNPPTVQARLAGEWKMPGGTRFQAVVFDNQFTMSQPNSATPPLRGRLVNSNTLEFGNNDGHSTSRVQVQFEGGKMRWYRYSNGKAALVALYEREP